MCVCARVSRFCTFGVSYFSLPQSKYTYRFHKISLFSNLLRFGFLEHLCKLSEYIYICFTFHILHFMEIAKLFNVSIMKKVEVRISIAINHCARARTHTQMKVWSFTILLRCKYNTASKRYIQSVQALHPSLRTKSCA